MEHCRVLPGNINEQTLMDRLKADATDNTSLAEHLSETNFYLGKYYLSLGDLDSATALFKLAVANNVHNFVEHRYALLELSLGRDKMTGRIGPAIADVHISP